MAQDDELLKTEEVARLLRVHPKHVYRLLGQGLPGRRVGGEWRFVRDEVLAWSSQRSGAAPPAAASAASAAALRPPLLGANGDVVIEVLLAQLVTEGKPLLGLVQCDRASALAALERRQLVMAGYHEGKPPAHLDAKRLARLHLVRREVGLACAASVRLREVTDIEGLRLATRPASAGVRAHFDRALGAAGATSRGLKLRTTTFASHRDAVCAVVRGEADVALSTAAWAERVGLRFLALAEEPYDLLLFADSLGEPCVVGACEVAQSKALRASLERIAGYDARATGQIRYELDDA